MRVGIFTDDFYPESGGVTRSIELQLRALAEAGHHVTLFAPDKGFTPPGECAWEGVPSWHPPDAPSHLCSLRLWPRLASRIAADHPDLDVIHSQNERGSMFLAAQVAERLAVPHVHTFHSNYAGTHRGYPVSSALNSLTYLGWSGSWLRALVRADRCVSLAPSRFRAEASDSPLAARDWRSLARIASAFSAFTSPAEFVVDSIVAASGDTLAERGIAVPSGVADAFGQARRRRPRGSVTRFVSAGRLGPEKRVDVLLDAFDQLGRDDAELLIIGSGSASAERTLRQRAERIAHGQVRFLGHFTEVAALAAEFADADVFVLASHRFDTQGMVLAEAAATGTPILYCDDRLTVGTGPDNALRTGASATQLAAGMRELMDDQARLERMSAASRALAPSLSVAAMRTRYLGVYRAAVEARPERPSGEVRARRQSRATSGRGDAGHRDQPLHP
jgi:glycosyltransferase involved in cell wall biosynthesis